MNEQEDKKIEFNLKPLGILEFTIFLLKRNIVTVLYHFQIHGTNYDDVFKAIFRCRKIRNKVTFLQMGRFFFCGGKGTVFFFPRKSLHGTHSLEFGIFFFSTFRKKQYTNYFFFFFPRKSLEATHSIFFGYLQKKVQKR